MSNSKENTVKKQSDNPNNPNYDPDNQPSGIINKTLTPLGNGLGKVLSPVGYVVGGVTKPVTSTVGGITKPVLSPTLGQEDERAEILGGNKRPQDWGDQSDKERFGGKEQGKDNPLGL
ncbi:uncharacterized protein J3D65DRAFT_608099 [Phyllosticta citribraziliensis]|uniref:Uncharacterized protein n=1 Tax=Phyllosticta citribraziliensis TaxID=989973 RepID=A0ABR1M7W8_9PEZI